MKKKLLPYIYPEIKIQPFSPTDIISMSVQESGDGLWYNYDELFS